LNDDEVGVRFLPVSNFYPFGAIGSSLSMDTDHFAETVEEQLMQDVSHVPQPAAKQVHKNLGASIV
jgi:hypothetical protein